MNNNPQNSIYQNNNYPGNQQRPYQNQNAPVKKNSTSRLVLMIVGIVFAVIFLLAVGTVAIIRFIINADDAKYSARNNEWVQKMNDAFPDDEFTYVGFDTFGVTGLGTYKNKNVIVVSSRNIPDRKITVGWDENHTKLVTDYNYYLYEEELDEYYKEVIGRYFSPDDMKVNYWITFENKTELKLYTFEEFKASHSEDYELTAFMKYRGEFPSEEEMTRSIDLVIANLDDAVNMTIYLSHDSLDYGDNKEGNERYILAMESPTRIQYLDHYTINWITNKAGKNIRRDIKETIYEDKDVD